MKQSREGFLEAMGKCEDATSKEQLRYKRSLDLIEFMVALAEENRETIPILSERLECWNPSVSSELQVRYFKGIGAYLTEQFDIAKQHFTFVVEKGQKSGFAPLAQSYLDRLNP
ncbi:MAG: hypothetical protein E7666_01290 [Ruminococcaceae bacterium]|nr:hypothetical protein [Oscillospiraceae bacterium]